MSAGGGRAYLARSVGRWAPPSRHSLHVEAHLRYRWRLRPVGEVRRPDQHGGSKATLLVAEAAKHAKLVCEALRVVTQAWAAMRISASGPAPVTRPVIDPPSTATRSRSP